MSEQIYYWRFRIGRWLIHAGLLVWPEGRCRGEVVALLTEWAAKVRQEIGHERTD